MPLECPNCQSDNIQAVSVAYHAGVTNINTRSKHSAHLGIGLAGGGLGVGVLSGGKTRTQGVSVSNLSQQLTPPSKMDADLKRIGCLGLLALVLAIVWGAAAGNGTAMGILLVAAIGGSSAWAFHAYHKAFEYNRDVLPGLLETWNRSWLCLRCGDVFELAR